MASLWTLSKNSAADEPLSWLASSVAIASAKPARSCNNEMWSAFPLLIGMLPVKLVQAAVDPIGWSAGAGGASVGG